MQWVFDASTTLAWCFADEKTPAADALLDRLSVTPAAVPQVWPLEVANVLLIATRKGRISAADRSSFVSLLQSLPIHVDTVPAGQVFTTTLSLAESHQLTSYDASYL